MIASRTPVSRMVAAALVAVTTLLLGTYGSLRYRFERDHEWTKLRSELAVETHQIAVGLASPVWNIDRSQIDDIMQGLEGVESVRAVVVDAAGRRHVRVRDAQWSLVPAASEGHASDDVELTQPIQFAGQKIGVVRVIATPRFINANVRAVGIEIASAILVIDALLVFCVYLAIWSLVIRPLVRLEKYAQTVSGGGDEAAPKTARSAELESVRSSIETMVQRLRSRYLELQASEERFRKIFDSVNDAISIHDSETGELLAVNNRTCQMFGYSFEEMRELGIEGLSAGELSPPITAVLREAASGRPQILEWRARHRDGHAFWTEVSLLSAEIGGTRRIVVVTRDITQRREMQDALAAEKDFTDTAIDSISGLFFVQKRDGRFVRWNMNLEKAVGPGGPPLAEITGRPHVHPEDRELIEAAVTKVFESGAAQVEARIMAGDPPAARNFVFNARRMESRGEQFLVATGVDITDRVQAEAEREKLQKEIALSAADWKQTFDTVNTPIVITASDGSIVRVNRAAVVLSGREERQLIGRSLSEVSSSGPWETAAQLVLYAMEHKSDDSSAETKDTNGRTWDLALSGFASPAGGAERFILVLWDITRIVELQESLGRSETLSAMGALLGGVAHEVRNPLFGISATLDAYDAELRQPELVECAGTLRREVDRLKTLMQELLDFGRPTMTDVEPALIDEVVREAIERRERDARVSNVTFETSFEETPPLLMDRSRVGQVFDNLIDNARQHAPAGGVVRVSSALVDYAGRQWVEARVEDTGPGFAQGDLDRVFDPFYSLRDGGTGLGLSIVQRIVEEHGGKVNAANRPAGGASVTVRLPLSSVSIVERKADTNG